MLINCSGYNFRPSASDVPVSDVVKKRFGKSDVDEVFGILTRVILGTYTGNGPNDDKIKTRQTINVGVKPIAVLIAQRASGFNAYANNTFTHVLWGGLALPNCSNSGITITENGFEVLMDQDTDFGTAIATNQHDTQYNYIVWY